VGTNGSGKTNALSIAADALFELAAEGHSDILPAQASGGRSYFRILGASTRRTGAPHSLAIVSATHDTSTFYFHEKTGPVSHADAKSILPEDLHPSVGWAEEEDRSKGVTATQEASRSAFQDGAYCYFPSSRFESPDWLNNSGVPDASFPTVPRFTGRLNKPLFVESGMAPLTQWIMSLILESRMDVTLSLLPGAEGSGPQPTLVPIGGLQQYVATFGSLRSINQVLQVILGRPDAHFVWLGRQSPTKVGISHGPNLVARSLNSLSAGQATLLNIFGTLLRYADWSRAGKSTTFDDVAGVCLVDEIDAHMHVDLQFSAIPQLISMFGNVQFLLSCHSPLCILGMAAKFGQNVSLVSLPTGEPVSAEDYSEFQNAFEAMKGTKAFAKEVELAVSTASEKLLVWLEGETDPQYLTNACVALARDELLNKVEFAWIGAKEQGKKTNFHSGKDALNHTLAFLKARPGVVKRRVLLMYDNDAHKPDWEAEGIYVRSMPSNLANDVVKAGIENLLPSELFSDAMFETKVITKPNGTVVTTKEIRKVLLCDETCAKPLIAERFLGFAPVLDAIEALVALVH
jgi:hypothetical protein